jgi:hypothetical protein
MGNKSGAKDVRNAYTQHTKVQDEKLLNLFSFCPENGKFYYDSEI